MGLSSLSASKKISSSKQDLVSEWEQGKSLPTWSQIAKLAKAYNIPDLILFSKEEIKKDKSIPDYRVGKHKNDDEKVKKLINLVIGRQKWLEQKLKNQNRPKNHLQGSGRSIQNPAELAKFIAQKLEINIQDIKETEGSYAHKEVLNYLIEKTEKNGVFVGKTVAYHKLEVNDMRGLFISNDYCPFIVLNRKDAVSAQIFSFVHELSHLFRKSDSISNSLDFRTTNNTLNSEEVFCNQVAAELLLPVGEFQKEFYDKSDISALSDLYKVSEICVFYRLADLGKIRTQQQRQIEETILAETAENIKRKAAKDKEREGGNYYNLMKDSNGGLFNRVVADAYFENRIGYVEASNLLRFSVEMI